MAKMTQAIMTEPGNIIYQEVDIPEVKPDQIKVKMKRIGICGSDIHVNHGKHPYSHRLYAASAILARTECTMTAKY